MLEERPLTWSHLIDAEKQFARFVGEWWDWEAGVPSSDETSCILVHRPPIAPKARAIRDWLHDTYIGECFVSGFYFTHADLKQSYLGPLPLAVRYRFPTFDDKLLFTLRWF